MRKRPAEVGRHRFHGDPARFGAVADLVVARFPEARYVADVAGGQGMLSRLLRKRHNVCSEVIDPRGWTLRGVPSRQEAFAANMADHYDLVVGLHPDEALREVVLAARRRPVLVVPCCNFWSGTTRLGRDALVESIRRFHAAGAGSSELVPLGFAGPYNVGLVLIPSTEPGPPPAADVSDEIVHGLRPGGRSQPRHAQQVLDRGQQGVVVVRPR